MKINWVCEEDYRDILDYLCVMDNAISIGYLDPPPLTELKKYVYAPDRSLIARVDRKIKGLTYVYDGVNRFCMFTLSNICIEPDIFQEFISYVYRMGRARGHKYIQFIDVPEYMDTLIDGFREFGFNVSRSFRNRYYLDGEYFDAYHGYIEIEGYEELRYAGQDLYPLEDVEKPDKYMFRYRYISLEDVDSYLEAINHPNVYKYFGKIVYSGEVYREDVSRRIMDIIRDRYSHGIVCVDEEAGKAVGFLILRQARNPLSRHVGRISVFVNPSYHGLGIGKRLMQEAEILAMRMRLRKLELFVLSYNEAARKLYERTGFYYCGSLPGIFNGEYHEIMSMEKFL